MPRSLIAAVLVALAAVTLAAPVPRAQVNQWLIAMDGDLFLFTEGDEKPTKLTDGKSRYEDPAWSPDGKRIAYSSNKSDHSQIYVMDADGKNVTQLTHSEQNHYAPNWSPDGRTIAFHREGVKDNEICTVNAKDGKDFQILSNSEDFDPVFSPDGKTIAFVTAREPGEYMLYTMDEDGQHATKLIDYSVFSPAARPAWSPDGKRIAFPLETENGFELHLVRPDGRELRAITKFGHNKVERSPSWSPDGKKLSFLLYDYSDEGKGHESLWVMDANGDNPKELLKLGRGHIYPIAQWRPK